MRAASKTLLIVIALAAASASCRKPASDENATIDHHNEGITDIESLPPDESDATPSAELANGDDEPTNQAEPSNADTAHH